MSTPSRDEYITLISGASALMCGSLAINCYDWSALFGAGESRGRNRTIPGLAGAVARPHVRGELSAELLFRCRGDVDVNGVPQPKESRRDNVLSRISEVREFLSGAPGRQLELRLDTSAGAATEPVTFLAFGQVTFPVGYIAEFRVLVSVPSGLFPTPVAGALEPGPSGYTAGY